MKRTCPHCGQEKEARGFDLHVSACELKVKMAKLRKRYAQQLGNMTPEQAERFLRKAQGV